MTTTDVLVAPAAKEDPEWCARLMASNEPWITLGRGLDDCRARCRHLEYLLLVARQGHLPAGFCLLHPRGLAGSPYVASIAVDPLLRGHGIGAALMAHAERQVRGARHIFLCVSSFNLRARNFYQRLGYTAAGELQDFIIDGASEILMQKRLS